MSKTILVAIPVSPEAAVALADAERRERIGRLVTHMLRPGAAARDPLADLIAQARAAAHQDSLTDEAIDAELAAYNAERRS